MNADDDGELKPVAVPESAVFTSEDCTLLEDPSSLLSLVSEQKLAYGSQVWASDDDVAACLLPTETGKPLTKAALLSLTAGTCVTVLDRAVGSEDNFEIMELRANSRGMVWTEAAVLSGRWRVYHASVSDFTLGEPVLADEGDSTWEMPSLAVAGNCAWWQVLPVRGGVNQYENSLLKRASFGKRDAEVAWTSEGRFCTPPYGDRDGLVATPRAALSGTYYQLTRLDAASGEVTDALVLPASMRPLDAGYGKTGFSFAFDGIYNYGGGIANLGSYTPAEPVNASADTSVSTPSYEGAAWFRFPRTPLVAPAWCGNLLMVKSTSAVCGIDLETREYVALDVLDGAGDYGDYLASTGTGRHAVTFSNVDHTSIQGSREKYCLVRVWSSLR